MFRYLAAAILFGVAAPASAASMWVHDAFGTLGKVNIADGSVKVIDQMPQVMTDIAFDPKGRLFGITFGSLYAISRQTGATRYIGDHGVRAGNALAFGADGTLYASGAETRNLYALDISTGAGTDLGRTGHVSGGDLAFVGRDLYLASTSSLVKIDLTDLSASRNVGPFGVPGVYGIASTGKGDLSAVAGTTIYDVDLETGAVFNGRSFANQGLVEAYGQAFATEAGAPDPDTPAPVPLPASIWLLGAGLFGLGALRRRRKAD